MTNRRDFIKKTLLTGAAAFAAPSFLHSENEMPAIASLANESNMKKENDNNPLIISNKYSHVFKMKTKTNKI